MGLGRYLQCLSVPEMVSDFMCFLGSRCSTLFNPEIWSCRQISNWWYTYPSEKYEFVSWDDDIPNIWKNKKCLKHFETTNQDMLELDNAIILSNSTLKYLDWRFPKQKQYPLVI